MTSVPVTTQERIPIPVSPASRGASGGGAYSLSDVLRVLKQRIFLILFIWIFISGAGVGGTLYLNKNHQLYRGVALVQVESPHPPTPMQWTNVNYPPDLLDRWVNDEIVRITNTRVLQRTLQVPVVRETQWYAKKAAEDPALLAILDELADDLQVDQIPRSNFIRVMMTTQRRVDAPAIINTVLDRYLAELNLGVKTQYDLELLEYQDRQKSLEAELERIRDDKVLMASELNAPGVIEGLNVAGEKLRIWAQEVTLIEAEKLQYKAAWENLVGVDPGQLALSPMIQSRIQQDPQIQGLRNFLLNLDQERQILLQQVGENHRSVLSLEPQIAVLQQKLAEVTQQREGELRELEVNSARTIYLNAVQAELELRQRMMLEEAVQRDLDGQMVEYRLLEERQRRAEMQAEGINEYIGQLLLITGRADQRLARVHIVDALKPVAPHFPRVGLFIAAGSFLGLLAGLGLAMLLEVADTSIRTTRDVVRHGRVPILGPIPDIDDEEVPIDQVELASHTAPRSMIAEAFRAVRTNLMLSSPAEGQRSIVVASARPEEGRTTVAVNLAISLGQSGRRVLLIDANFHRPALGALFPDAQSRGLSHLLIGRGTLVDLVNRTDCPNVDVLTSGPVPPNPTELLASDYFRKLIAHATGELKYDQVIFDGPPILLVSDALVMSGQVDGVVLVCRAKSTSRGVLRRACEQLQQLNARIFGVVLNAAQVARGGYFREQIRTYYDYQTDEAIAAQTARALPREDDELGLGDEPPGEDEQA